MRTMRAIWLVGALLIAGTAVAAPAYGRGGWHAGAHGGGHARVGVVIGGPLFWPGYYYPPPYYAAPLVAAPPPVYIERSDETDDQYWYFCRNPKGYYPYVQECPAGWVPVTPQAPAN